MNRGRKEVLGRVVVLYLLSICSILWGCGMEVKKDSSTERPAISTETNTVAETLQDPKEIKEVLDAGEITLDMVNNQDYRMEVDPIVDNTPGYEEEYNDLKSFVSAVISTRDSVMYKQKECYVSRIPIYYWVANRNEVGTASIELLVFSKDLKNSATYSMHCEDGTFIAGSIGDTEEGMLQILKKHKKTKFIFISNGSETLLLNEENKIFNDSVYCPDITIKGDYYHALDYKTLAVSYQDLTSEKNLVKFKLKVKGDKVIDLIH